MPSPNLLWNTCMPERRPCEGAAFCGGLLRRHLRAGEGVLAAAVAVAAPAISTVAAARARVAAAIAERRRREALVLRREPLERAFGQFVEETALDVVAGLAVQHARLRMAQAGQRVLDLGAIEEVQAAPYTRHGTEALKSAVSITRLCALLRAGASNFPQMKDIGEVVRVPRSGLAFFWQAHGARVVGTKQIDGGRAQQGEVGGGIA